MKTRHIIQTIIFSTAVPLLLSACGGDSNSQQPQTAPPPQVDVVTLKTQAVDLTTELPGRAVASRRAEVRPQVTGIIVKRLFAEGSQVEAGQQLYQIDASRYEAELQTAEANVARVEATLEATRDRFERYQDLLKQRALSQQNFDDAKANYRQAQAELAVAKANLKAAQIDLEYTRVYAPISGHIGKSNVTEGTLVTAQQAQVLATIVQLDPIYVDLAQSAAELIEFRQQLAAGTLAQDGNAGVTVKLENGLPFEQRGTLQFSEMNVNESTGTVVLRAEFPNPDHLLLPGMFVRAQIDQGTRPEAMLVPQSAVTRNREGKAQVFVVNADNVAQPREVTASRAIGNQWLIAQGLQAGERVVVTGLQKIAPGATVNPVEQQQSISSAGGQ